MINPDLNDIGREVIYRARHLPPNAAGESGILTSFNDEFVFARYGKDTHSKGAKREDLHWGHTDTV
jgi:hypothetical protein